MTQSRTRRVLGKLLFVGAVAAAMSILRGAPTEREVELRIPRNASVTEVELAWATSEHPDVPLTGSRFHFTPGTAPARVTCRVLLPDGRYLVDLRTARGEDELRSERPVDLDGASRVSLLAP